MKLKIPKKVSNNRHNCLSRSFFLNEQEKLNQYDYGTKGHKSKNLLLILSQVAKFLCYIAGNLFPTARALIG